MVLLQRAWIFTVCLQFARIILKFLLICSPGKKAAPTGKGKGKASAEAAEAEQLSGPSKEELRATIIDILKKVDFNVVCYFPPFLLFSQVSV